MISLLFALVKASSFKPNESFDICYVNLERETERNEHIIKLLTTANCTFTRFNAVDGVAVLSGRIPIENYCKPYDLDLSIDLEKYKKLPFRLHGMVGCKLSHYINLRKIEKTQSARPVFILEDDADLEYDFVERIEAALKTAPNDWDVIMVTEHSVKDERNTGSNTDHLIRLKWITESLFIINGAKSAKKLADDIDKFCYPERPIDTFFSEECEKRRLNFYEFKEKIVVQMREKFESAIPNSWKLHSKQLKKSLSDFVESQIN